MASAGLQLLPVEVLRNIALSLSSTAALAFTLTCRTIHAACDDWATWRDLLAAQHTLACSYSTILSSQPAPKTWKRYVVADALAQKRRLLNRRDLENWFPHMVVMHRMLYTEQILAAKKTAIC